MGISVGRAFSKHVLRVEISGPKISKLTLVDALIDAGLFWLVEGLDWTETRLSGPLSKMSDPQGDKILGDIFGLQNTVLMRPAVISGSSLTFMLTTSDVSILHRKTDASVEADVVRCITATTMKQLNKRRLNSF
jgi:hypothetical protein